MLGNKSSDANVIFYRDNLIGSNLKQEFSFELLYSTNFSV